MTDYGSWSEPERFGIGAIYDETPAGALLLAYDKDDAFTAILREIVPVGMMGWQRNPYAWVIDADYKDDVLKACRTYFDWCEHGDIE